MNEKSTKKRRSEWEGKEPSQIWKNWMEIEKFKKNREGG
jgi:hypothetical protein